MQRSSEFLGTSARQSSGGGRGTCRPHRRAACESVPLGFLRQMMQPLGAAGRAQHGVPAAHGRPGESWAPGFSLAQPRWGVSQWMRVLGLGLCLPNRINKHLKNNKVHEKCILSKKTTHGFQNVLHQNSSVPHAPRSTLSGKGVVPRHGPQHAHTGALGRAADWGSHGTDRTHFPRPHHGS